MTRTDHNPVGMGSHRSSQMHSRCKDILFAMSGCIPLRLWSTTEIPRSPRQQTCVCICVQVEPFRLAHLVIHVEVSTITGPSVSIPGAAVTQGSCRSKSNRRYSGVSDSDGTYITGFKNIEATDHTRHTPSALRSHSKYLTSRLLAQAEGHCCR